MDRGNPTYSSTLALRGSHRECRKEVLKRQLIGLAIAAEGRKPRG
jgi:hypothetical protein